MPVADEGKGLNTIPVRGPGGRAPNGRARDAAGPFTVVLSKSTECLHPLKKRNLGEEDETWMRQGVLQHPGRTEGSPVLSE